MRHLGIRVTTYANGHFDVTNEGATNEALTMFINDSTLSIKRGNWTVLTIPTGHVQWATYNPIEE